MVSCPKIVPLFEVVVHESIGAGKQHRFKETCKKAWLLPPILTIINESQGTCPHEKNIVRINTTVDIYFFIISDV